MFGEAVDEEAEHHHEAERHDALGLLDKDGGGQKERVFEEGEATFHAVLLFVRLDQLLIGEQLGIEDVGGDQEARLAPRRALQRRRIECHRRLDLPDGAVGGGVLARASGAGWVGWATTCAATWSHSGRFVRLLASAACASGSQAKRCAPRCQSAFSHSSARLLRFARQRRSGALVALGGAHDHPAFARGGARHRRPGERSLPAASVGLVGLQDRLLRLPSTSQAPG